ncbi:ribulose phosphate epimerase [Paraliomyxa miuraensis]|uniref:ribulose phosphate epimerase n=1 Tax=Paraliomyxa miuraensis TaxID=376150 RepID=UPI00225A05D4|nr:ribulose phosphate epimerase [Paraliomyxa miuraensis]MCX4244387.1 ribulose phosphate epimerase [Paraliomyxa miuraensis]
MPKPASCLPLALAALVACGHEDSTFAPQGESSSGEEPSSSSSVAGTTMAPEEPEPEPGSDSSGGETTSNFLSNPDAGGDSYQCDPYTQNCPPGQKCMYWANDGGSSWNATRCTDIAPDAGDVGEPCTVEGSGTSGIDTCVVGAMCWNVDPDTNEGTCAEMCTGSETEPFCSDPGMICSGRGPYLCLPTCCPIEQDCPEGQACYPVQDTFFCAPDASGDAGAFGDSCEFINVCNAGLMCLGSSSLPPGYPCEAAAGCCTAMCELGHDECNLLDPALECVAWYEPGRAPPGYEFVGVCVLPE